MLNTFAIDDLQDGQCIPAYSMWQSITPRKLDEASRFVDEMIHIYPLNTSSFSYEYISYTYLLWCLFDAMTQKELDELVDEWAEFK